jgi:hypothetical protein
MLGPAQIGVCGLIGGGLMLAAHALGKLGRKQTRLTAGMLKRALGEDTPPRESVPEFKWIGILLAAVLVAAGPAHSTTITNGTPNNTGGGLVLDTFQSAEYFDLSSPETLRGIEFADEEYTPTFNGTLSYFIYANSGFFPGALLAQGTNPAISKSFVVNGGTLGVSIVKYDFNLITPIDLSAGRYWVGLNFANGAFVNGRESPKAILSTGSSGNSCKFAIPDPVTDGPGSSLTA